MDSVRYTEEEEEEIQIRENTLLGKTTKKGIKALATKTKKSIAKTAKNEKESVSKAVEKARESLVKVAKDAKEKIANKKKPKTLVEEVLYAFGV